MKKVIAILFAVGLVLALSATAVSAGHGRSFSSYHSIKAAQIYVPHQSNDQNAYVTTIQKTTTNNLAVDNNNGFNLALGEDRVNAGSVSFDTDVDNYVKNDIIQINNQDQNQALIV